MDEPGENKTKRVVTLDEFMDWGFRGLYGGETAADIARRKHLNRHQDIFDWMNSAELDANLERSRLAEVLLRDRNVRDPHTACQTHYEAGTWVRQCIIEASGTLPENQPTPAKSCIQLEWETNPNYRTHMN